MGSRAPFGYRRVKVSDGGKERPTLEVDPATAPVVKELFQSSLSGNGLMEICKALNDRGVTNRGKRWYKGGLHYLLTNEAYTGTAVWGRTSKGEKAQDPVRVEGAWPALVSRELFEDVQQAMRNRAPKVQRPARVGKQVPAERAAQVRRVRQALLRPGSQERPVRLLHLRHPVPGRRKDVQRPLPERPQGGGLRGREDQGSNPHRGDHRGAGDAGGRGDRRDGRGVVRQAGCHRRRARGRAEQAPEALRGP